MESTCAPADRCIAVHSRRRTGSAGRPFAGARLGFPSVRCRHSWEAHAWRGAARPGERGRHGTRRFTTGGEGIDAPHDRYGRGRGMGGHGPPSDGPVLAFGPFRLLPARQLLLEGERQVVLGSRALGILVVLVERAGEVVGKEELVARVWPDTFVEESNLRVHVAALRKALRDGRDGNRFLATIPGRGYCFVAPVSVAAPPAATAPQPASPAR